MKIATYNIQFCLGKDGEIDVERIAREIGDTDIIALQEVERHWERSLHLDEVKELSELFPDHYYVYGPGIDLHAGYRGAKGGLVSRRQQFGNMLLSRWPILTSRNHLLPHRGGDEDRLALQRCALEATVMTDRGMLRVVSTHLSHSSADDRARQIRELQARLAAAPGERSVLNGKKGNGYWRRVDQPADFSGDYIVMGDFNLAPGFPEYALLADDGAPAKLVDVADLLGKGGNDAWTCEESDGNNRIDYIFCSPSLTRLARDIHVDQQATGSDHQPVFAEFDIRPA
jgi:endonuclease/exonuclease/phosphatase family metal-dependent hydrolase